MVWVVCWHDNGVKWYSSNDEGQAQERYNEIFRNGMWCVRLYDPNGKILKEFGRKDLLNNDCNPKAMQIIKSGQTNAKASDRSADARPAGEKDSRLWAVCWIDRDRAKSLGTYSQQEALQKYQEMERGNGIVCMWQPGGTCAKKAGNINGDNYQMLEDEREMVQECDRDPPLPWLVKWHQHDHCETTECWSEASAKRAYIQIRQGGRWAAQLFGPGESRPREQYGKVMSDQEIRDSLLPTRQTFGRVERGVKHCIVSFPGVLARQWGVVMRSSINFGCVWTGFSGSLRGEWFRPWQNNTIDSYELGCELIVVQKENGTLGNAQTDEVFWIENIKKYPVRRMPPEELEPFLRSNRYI